MPRRVHATFPARGLVAHAKSAGPHVVLLHLLSLGTVTVGSACPGRRFLLHHAHARRIAPHMALSHATG